MVSTHRRLTLLLVLAVSVTAVAFSVPPITVRTSHRGAVSDLQVSADGETLFSAGVDGKLMVWDVQSGALLQSIRTDQLPTRAIRLYPDGERVAVYSSDGRQNRVSVWNWRDGERNFLHTPEDEVLTLQISPRESYIVYSMASLQSLRVLDGDTGRLLPYLRRRDTGIVTWMVIAGSEERVMTYIPATGEINYRTITTGRSAGTFQAPRGLSHSAVLAGRRFAAARAEDGALVVVDLLSGAQTARVDSGDIDSITVDPDNGEIVVLGRDLAGRRGIQRWEYRDGELQQRYAIRRTIPDGASSVVQTQQGLFAGDRDGTILQWDAFQSRPSTFADIRVEPINDLYAADQVLYVLTGDRLTTIASDFFSSQPDEVDDTTFLRQETVQLQTGDRSAFVPTGDRDLLIWTPANAEHRIQRHRLGTDQLRPLEAAVPGGLMATDAYENELLTLARSGTLEIRDRESGSLILSYRGRGLQTAIRSSRGVFVGKAASGVLDSSILRLNVRTRETIPLESRSDLVFSLHFDESRGRLYALGVQNQNTDQVSTVVEVFEGINLERRRTILDIPGEYPDAELITDPITGIAYTTLDDRGGVLRWDGRRVTELVRNQAHIPRTIYVEGDFLYTLNRDGTASVIDRFDGTPVLDLYVMADTDGGWIALRPDGRFFASQNALAQERYLSLNVPGEELSDRRLMLRDAPVESAEEDQTREHRFDSARDSEVEAETDDFDPQSGAPAPSS